MPGRFAGGAPKLLKTTMPAVEKMLLRMRAGELGLGMQKHAARVIKELVKAGDLEAPAGDEPAAAEQFVFLVVERDASSEAARVAAGIVGDELADSRGFERLVSGGAAAKDVLASQASFARL